MYNVHKSGGKKILQNFKSILPQVSCKRRASVKRPSSYIILGGKNDFHKDFH